jgi:GNAT superfamily N-acetyltransferase
MIRLATEHDRPRVVAMAKEFHAVAGLPFEFSAPMASALFSASISETNRICIIFAPDGIARGVLVAQAGMHRFAPVKVAEEIMWWVDPAHRGASAMKMLAAYERWARDRGCSFASMVGLGYDPTPARLYEHRGYVAAERHYLKPL